MSSSGGRARRAAVVALALLTACGALRESAFQEPEVRLAGVRVAGIGGGGGVVDVLLEVTNPNRYALNIERLTYTLRALDSTEIGHGASTAPLRVAARDSARISLPLAVKWAGLRAVGREGLGSGRLAYWVSGEVTLRTPLGSFTRAYERE